MSNTTTPLTDETMPNFSCITCPSIQDMCQAVWDLRLWKFIRDFDDDKRGFMFSNDPRLNELDNHPLVTKHNHSGASYGWCARNVQYIAKNGVDAFNKTQ